MIDFLISAIPIIGMLIALYVWVSTKFAIRVICLQLTVISYLLCFCVLYLIDFGHINVPVEYVTIIIRSLHLVGLICISTHLFYFTKRIKRDINRRKEKNN